MRTGRDSEIMDITDEDREKIKQYKEERQKIDAEYQEKFLEKFCEHNQQYLYVDRQGKLLPEQKKWVSSQVQAGLDKEERDYIYGINQLRNKNYSQDVHAVTDAAIETFKAYRKENNATQFSEAFDDKGNLKEMHKLWLLERIEAHREGSDKHRRPLYSVPVVEVIFHLAKIERPQKVEENKANNDISKCKL